MRAGTERASEPRRTRRDIGSPRRLRVFMMDLLSIVPYYDGHLCAALAAQDGLALTLGAITYQHDRGYFRRQGVRNRPGLDIAARLPLPAAFLRPLKGLEALVNLAALALRFVVRRPDVLHVQFLPLMELGIPIERWLLRAARARGVKVLHTVHNVLPPATRHSIRAGCESSYREVYERADALICHNESAKTRLIREFGVSPDRVRVIPHGPLFECSCSQTREEARGRLGLAEEECLVLLQGILEPYKGVGFLLKAWRKVAASGKRARLAIVGTGKTESTQSIRGDVAALGIGSTVRLELEFVTVEELGWWYRASDVLVYPYREATTSGALMTGITYGKAIVATTAPGFSQLLRDGENALLVEYGDVNGLAGALGRLISDDPFRRRLARQAHNLWATLPRWPAIARQTHECYEAVVAGQRVNPAGSILRGAIRTGAAHLLRGTGTDKVMGALAGSGNAPVVLAYHRVVEDFAAEAKRSIPAMLISRSMLQRHLEAMSRRYQFVSLDELASRRLNGQRIHRPIAAVTFDDGYGDFYENAFPLLQKMGIPSAVFVVTSLIGTRDSLTHDLLYRQLVRAFSRWRNPSRELARLLFALEIDAKSAERIRSVATDPFPAMRAVYLTLTQTVTRRFLEALTREVGMEEIGSAECRPLSWEMLRQMRRSEVTIGSHTRTHPLLTNERRRTINDEVVGSKADLERELGATIRHFAYPGGSFTADIVRMVSDAGYCQAYTTCLHRDSDRPQLTIPRKLLWEDSCLNARGRFSSAVMGCRVMWSFDVFAGCDQDHTSHAA